MVDATRRHIVCHHEAGHAVAALLAPLVGLPARQCLSATARVKDDGSFDARVKNGRPPGLKADLKDPATRGWVESCIVEKFCGPLAECRRCEADATLRMVLEQGPRTGLEPLDDGMQAALLATHIINTEAEFWALLARMWRRAKRLSRTPPFWPAVDKLADALMASGTLTEARIRAIVDGAREEWG